jgi:hypothetical protein
MSNGSAAYLAIIYILMAAAGAVACAACLAYQLSSRAATAITASVLWISVTSTMFFRRWPQNTAAPASGASPFAGLQLASRQIGKRTVTHFNKGCRWEANYRHIRMRIRYMRARTRGTKASHNRSQLAATGGDAEPRIKPSEIARHCDGRLRT